MESLISETIRIFQEQRETILYVALFFLIWAALWLFLHSPKPKPTREPSVPLTNREKKELVKQRQKNLAHVAQTIELERELAGQAIREGFKSMVFDQKMSRRCANRLMAQIAKDTRLPVIQPVTRRFAEKIGQSKAEHLKREIRKRLNRHAIVH